MQTPTRAFHNYFVVVHTLLFAGWVMTLARHLYHDQAGTDMLRDMGVGCAIVLVLFMGMAASAARCTRRARESEEVKEMHKKLSGLLQHAIVLLSLVDIVVQMHSFFILEGCNVGMFTKGKCYIGADHGVTRMSLDLATMFLQTFPFVRHMLVPGGKVLFSEDERWGAAGSLYSMFEYFFIEWWSIVFSIIAVGEVTGGDQQLFFGVTVLNLVVFTFPLVHKNMYEGEDSTDFHEDYYANHLAVVEILTDGPTLAVTIAKGLYSGNAVLSAKLVFDIVMMEKNFFWKIIHTNAKPNDKNVIQLQFFDHMLPAISYPEAWEVEYMGICSTLFFSAVAHMTCLGFTVYGNEPATVFAKGFITADIAAIALCMSMLALLNDKKTDTKHSYLLCLLLFVSLQIGSLFSGTYLWLIRDPPAFQNDSTLMQIRLIGSLVPLIVVSLEYFRKGIGCKYWHDFFVVREWCASNEDGSAPGFAFSTLILEWLDMAIIFALAMDVTIESRVRVTYLATTCINLALYIMPTILFMKRPFDVMRSTMHIAVCDICTDVPNLITTITNKTYKGRELVVFPMVLSVVLMMKNACFNPIYYYGSKPGRSRGQSTSLIERARGFSGWGGRMVTQSSRELGVL